MQSLKSRPIKVEPPKETLELLLLSEKEVKDKDTLGMPDCRKYYAIPETKPHLRSFIQEFNWNTVTKFLNMVIDENPHLSTYEWICQQSKETDSNAKTSITIVLMDLDDHELGRIRFSGLTLISHNCGLVGQSESCKHSAQLHPVRHALTFTYEKEESLHPGDYVTESSEGLEDWCETQREIRVEKSDEVE